MKSIIKQTYTVQRERERVGTYNAMILHICQENKTTKQNSFTCVKRNMTNSKQEGISNSPISYILQTWFLAKNFDGMWVTSQYCRKKDAFQQPVMLRNQHPGNKEVNSFISDTWSTVPCGICLPSQCSWRKMPNQTTWWQCRLTSSEITKSNIPNFPVNDQQNFHKMLVPWATIFRKLGVKLISERKIYPNHFWEHEINIQKIWSCLVWKLIPNFHNNSDKLSFLVEM